jgi:hypothetical protein
MEALLILGETHGIVTRTVDNITIGQNQGCILYYSDKTQACLEKQPHCYDTSVGKTLVTVECMAMLNASFSSLTVYGRHAPGL